MVKRSISPASRLAKASIRALFDRIGRERFALVEITVLGEVLLQFFTVPLLKAGHFALHERGQQLAGIMPQLLGQLHDFEQKPVADGARRFEDGAINRFAATHPPAAKDRLQQLRPRLGPSECGRTGLKVDAINRQRPNATNSRSWPQRLMSCFNRR